MEVPYTVPRYFGLQLNIAPPVITPIGFLIAYPSPLLPLEWLFCDFADKGLLADILTTVEEITDLINKTDAAGWDIREEIALKYPRH